MHKDAVDMVASSLVGVLKQSLNASFRKECYLLLGVRTFSQVANSKDAHDKILALLTKRTLKLESSQGDVVPTTSQSDTEEETHKEMACIPQQYLESSKGRGPSSPCPLTSGHNENQPNGKDCSPERHCGQSNAQFADNDSDEETQLEWDAATY